MPSKQEIREYFAKFGKEGGKTRARNMTPEQRREASRLAAEARWSKTKKVVEEITRGTKKLEKAAKRKSPRK